jgi:outer membrane protein TolC
VLVFLTALLFFTKAIGAQESASKPLDLVTYIKKNLEVNELIQQAQLQKSIATEKKNRASDYFQNSLLLQPGFYVRDFKSDLGNAFHEERTSLFGQMRQRLPTGSVLGAESTYFLDEVNPTVGGGLNNEYRVFIEQPFWRNAFGSLWRRQDDSARAEVQQQELTLQATIVDSCLTSTENYLNAYVSQAENHLYSQAFEVAEKAKQIAENGFSNSFLRRIDYLNSQSDFLKVKTELLRTQTEVEQRFNTLRVQAEDEKLQGPIANPHSFFDKIPFVKEIDRQQVLKLQALSAQIEAQKQNYYAEKNRNRSAVDLGAETRSSRTVQASTFGLIDAQQEITQVYLRLELPLINKTMRADVATAHHNWQLSEFERQKQEKLILDQFFQNLSQYKNREEQIKISLENVKIKQAQLKEATKLLRIGRIEFNDYVIYRDSLLNEEVTLLRVQTALWQLKARLAQYDTTFLNQCKDALL